MKVKLKTPNKTKKTKKNIVKPLFPHSDWISVVMGVIVLSKTDGMGHHLGHAGILFLMLALIARPISFFWNQPLKYRRTIGIFAFATALAHAIYALFHVLDGNLVTIFTMTPKHQLGIWAGIISFAAITPAAVTSFPSLQKKLGKRWRQIHLLTVPAVALATFHTVLVGPHYMAMAHVQIEVIDYLRTYGIAILTILVLFMRKRIFWSVLRLKKK